MSFLKANNKMFRAVDNLRTAQFTPSQLECMQLWYNTNISEINFTVTGGTKFVNSLEDLVGTKDATQTTDATKPLLSGSTIFFGETNNDGYLTHSAINKLDNIAYTFSCHMKWTEGSSTPSSNIVAPFGQESTPNNTIYLWSAPSHRFFYRNSSGTQGAGDVGSTEIMFDGNWHTLTFTVDTERLLKVYIDGNLVAERILNSSFMQFRSLGKGYSAIRYYWEGPLQNYSLFTRVLTFSEIRALHRYNTQNEPTL